MVHRQTCAYCRQQRGVFSRLTYLGAPEDGVSVHVDCVADFFKMLDGVIEAPKPKEEHCPQCGVIDNLTQQVVIGVCGQLRVHEVWLHPECETDYLRRLKS